MPTQKSAESLPKVPTLGQSVRPGELYDARSSQFLGVQIFDEDTIGKITIPLPNKSGEVKVEMANTFDKKSNVLGIEGQLSVDVLSGLVQVEGSGKYLNDKNSNSSQSAWAMYAHILKSESRLEIVDSTWDGNHIPDWVKDNYITSEVATHFVESVTYGGNAVVNLNARKSDQSEDTDIEGKLSVRLDKLKGVVSVSGSASAQVKAQFSDLDDQFDLSVYGDFVLGTVPMKASDVLDFFPDANTLIGPGNSLFVYLQPIPENLRKETLLINHLDDEIRHVILAAFANLDDVRSRFDILQAGAMEYKDILPVFLAKLDLMSTTFNTKHRSLLASLTSFLTKFQTDIDASDGSLLQCATSLFNQLTGPPDDYEAPKYPETLTGLEKVYKDFRRFLGVIDTLKRTASTLDQIASTALKSDNVSLFIMPPMGKFTVRNLMRFTDLFNKVIALYSSHKPKDTVYILYLEDPAALKRQLLNSAPFDNLDVPSLFYGTNANTPDGTMLWKKVTQDTLEVALAPRLSGLDASFDSGFGKWHVENPLEKLDSNGSYTIIVTGQRQLEASTPSPGSQLSPVFFLIRDQTNAVTLSVQLRESDVHVGGVCGGDKVFPAQPIGTDVQPGMSFWTALVRDLANGRWLLYFNGVQVREVHFQTDKWEKLFFDVGNTKWMLDWNRTLGWNRDGPGEPWSKQGFRVQAFASVFEKDDICEIAFPQGNLRPRK